MVNSSDAEIGKVSELVFNNFNGENEIEKITMTIYLLRGLEHMDILVPGNENYIQFVNDESLFLPDILLSFLHDFAC